MSKVTKQFNTSFFSGLPAFLGGKRKLVKLIMGFTKGKVFADAFLGGGSVSLYAKLLNYKVLCCDISDLSSHIGKGIICNQGVYIDKWDIKRLLYDSGAQCDEFMTREYPRLLPERFSRVIDRAIYNISLYRSSQKIELLYCFIIKVILGLRPFSNLSSHIYSKFFESGYDEKEVDAHRRPNKVLKVYLESVHKYFFDIAEKMNKSIFRGEYQPEFFQCDVFEFLNKIKADTVYLDPPYYKAGQYNEKYIRLEEILQKKKLKASCSPFANATSALAYLKKLVEACNKFENILLSYRAEGISGDEILALVKSVRSKAVLYELPYRYSIGVGAHKQKQKLVNELLVVA